MSYHTVAVGRIRLFGNPIDYHFTNTGRVPRPRPHLPNPRAQIYPGLENQDCRVMSIPESRPLRTREPPGQLS